MSDLSVEHKATNYETMRHIQMVQKFLNVVVRELMARAEAHDQSKLGSPEVEMFAEFTPKLAASTYGSEEYEGFRKAMGPALDHHYLHNRHHPEHHAAGVDGMNLIDLIEMFCDWKAATMRHADGDLRKSVEINTERFKLSPQLRLILANTVHLFESRPSWHCFGCGAGGMQGNFCEQCGAGRRDYERRQA